MKRPLAGKKAFYAMGQRAKHAGWKTPYEGAVAFGLRRNNKHVVSMGMFIAFQFGFYGWSHK